MSFDAALREMIRETVAEMGEHIVRRLSVARQPEGYTYEEAAELLGVSLRKIKQMAADGELPLMRLGSDLPRIHGRRLREYLDRLADEEAARHNVIRRGRR